ncbi:hypothetical protein CEXT_48821 [Caerostris extrusa]|uniref:Uncharacterized protein n=1 Tax=Caerostris extrusa TaxID=172846 RepID=A0AAV4RCW5_CAEEX|nr:hypothetical protein CEXT_48821 [Caerostris extrusa]
MLSPKSINMRFCRHFFQLLFFLSVETSPKFLFQRKADDYMTGLSGVYVALFGISGMPFRKLREDSNCSFIGLKKMEGFEKSFHKGILCVFLDRFIVSSVSGIPFQNRNLFCSLFHLFLKLTDLEIFTGVIFSTIRSIKIWKITFSLKRENVPQINRTAKEDKMLSPKSFNLRFCGHFFFTFCFFLSVATSPNLLFQSKADDFYVGVEWRLCGFVRGFGNALSKGSARGFQLDVYRP